MISVILPVFNGEKYLHDAVESVRAQSYRHWELIFVDDGSTDGSPAIMDKVRVDHPRTRIIRQPNRGPAAARNRGLSIARGEWIAFLDADDLYPADKFIVQTARLHADPALQVVLGRIRYVQLEGGAAPDMRFTEPDHTLVLVHLGGALFRSEVFVRVGGFDEAMRYGEDLDWFLRAHEARVKMLVVKQTTLHYRLHDANMTRGRTQRELNTFRALKKSLDRRRASGDVRPLPRWSDFDEAAPERSAAGDPPT